MRLKQVLPALALAMAVAPQHSGSAAELQYGRAGVPDKLPDLGPVGDGRRLFLELNCYLCHGGDATGGTGPGIAHTGYDSVYEATQLGEPLGGMPSFKKYINPTGVADITAFLASIGRKDEPTWWDWWVPYPKQ